MTARPAIGAALLLTRPRQWPILTVQLAVGMILALPARTGWPPPAMSPWVLGGAWLSWVVLLNGCTLAFNSAYDRDTGPVAYLARPPLPPAWLASAALAGMVTGAVLGWLWIGPVFGTVTAVCVLLSIFYSHPRVRWKARPGLDLMVNMIGYGAGTTAAGLSAGWSASDPAIAAGDTLAGVLASAPEILFIAGFGLLFGSLYPLTQLYQVAEDRRRRDRTLATALGPARSLDLALILGAAGGTLLIWGMAHGGAEARTWLPGVGLVAWIGHLAWWRWRVGTWTDTQHEKGMYRALLLWAVVDGGLVLGWLG